MTTHRSLKCKKTEIELSQNETEKQFKGFKGKIYAQEEEERSVKVLGEMLNQTFCKLQYTAILLTQQFSINAYRKGLNTMLPMANRYIHSLK